MKIIILSSSRNLKYGAGMNRVIFNAQTELNESFNKVIYISANSYLELLKGVAKIILENPFSFDYLIFNSLASIRKRFNSHWIFFLKTAKLFNIKIAIYWHEMPKYFDEFKKNTDNQFDLKLIDKYFKNKNYLHLCVSNACSSIAENFDKNANKQIVYNAIKPSPYLSKLQYNTFTIATVGSIQYIKGTDLWTDVALEVCKENEKVQFIWCGGALDKQLYQDCIEKVNKNSLEDRIIFFGHVEDANIIASAAHLFFSSSRIDSMPLAVLEAMSFGKNVIHYDSGGIQEAVGEQGIRIENFDVAETKNKILEKIKDFENDTNSIFNKQLYDRFYENFTPTLFVDRLKKILKENA
jgi:glycosyltransferase involved in cell wall biosynthesis